jgi:hypothetical protein
MQADDGNLYVVKFQGNPQGTRVLANEMLAAKQAAMLRLPVPITVPVELPPELSEELYFETTSGRQPIRPGLHLGSRVVITSLEGRSYDFLPQGSQYSLRNPGDLVGIRLFDLWTCNRDTRQLVVWKCSRDKKYTVTFIDNGHCFGGPEWNFAPLTLPNTPLVEPSAVEACLHWAALIATFPITEFESAEAGLIPPEWRSEDEQFTGIFEQLRIRQVKLVAEIRSRYSTLVSRLDTFKLRASMAHLEHTMSFANLEVAG